MDKTTEPQNSDPITVEICLSGAGSRAEKIRALKKMLSRCHPTVVRSEIFFLDDFKILEDL